MNSLEQEISNQRWNPFNRLFGEASFPLSILDREACIYSVNEEGRRTFELIAGGERWDAVPLLEILEAHGCTTFSYHFNRIAGGASRSATFDCELRCKGGETRLFSFHCWGITALENAPPTWRGPFVACQMEDCTEQRQAEYQLLKAKEKAERSTETKSQFLANMSHEIRTPIQTIMGMIDLLSDTELDREQREYTRQIRFSTDVLLSLVNDILDYSKIEAGRLELERIDIDLEKVIEQAVDLVSLEAHKKGLEVTIDIASDLPTLIKGDPVRLRQIVVNLTKNAVKFTREGGLVVCARRNEYKGKEAVTITVSDTGIGVSPELRPMLFTTFFQADTSTTRRFGGTGLGLAISRQLVQQMDGEIGMRANEEGGSTFFFTVPIERSEFDLPRSCSCADLDIRILVVDDRSASRRVTASYLAGLGYSHVEEAESGEEALRKLRQAVAAGRPFALCLIDMIMPEMDGWRLAAEINGDHRINAARLVLMVPQGSLGAEAKMTLLQWFNAYLNKPLKRDELAEALSCTAQTGLDLEVDRPEPVDTGRTASRAWTPRVLIVEDHPVNQKLFSLILEKLGCESHIAEDGLEAVERVNGQRFDLIFMDIQMPRMNGYEATKRLRAQGCQSPIIAVTASALSDERERCLGAGMDDVLVKPFHKKEIEESLNRWLQTAELQDLEELTPESPESREQGLAAGRPAEARSEELAVLDTAELVETFMGNTATVRSLLARYLEKTTAELAILPDLLADGNWERVRLEAHTIKGSALNLSAAELATAALEAELASKDMKETETKQAIIRLQTAFTRFKARAEAFLESGGPTRRG